MKIKDIKIGMSVVCKEKHDKDSNWWPSWVTLMDKTVGKKMTVVKLDVSDKTIQCATIEEGKAWWYKPEWLSPWEEEPKELVGYYQGIDVTGLDHDIIARMAENNNDLCSSKIYNMIAKLNRCKQVSPKTARLVDDLIKELVDILDLHEHEEKKDNRPLNNQIEILKEENEKLKETIEYLQEKKKNANIRKSCFSCLYGGVPKYRVPCSCCDENYNRWINKEKLK